MFLWFVKKKKLLTLRNFQKKYQIINIIDCLHLHTLQITIALVIFMIFKQTCRHFIN